MRHIVLIGFKNAGKSAVGKALADRLKLPFADLDAEIEKYYRALSGAKSRPTCRAIMQKQGESGFRKLEEQVLAKIIKSKTSLVLAVGGGTPLGARNRKLLSALTVVLVSAPKKTIFERMMVNGTPAFFPKNQDPYKSFQMLWREREPVYKKLAQITVRNAGSLQEAVMSLLKSLPPAHNSPAAPAPARKTPKLIIYNYMKIILLIHGPNLNFLGRRDASNYGDLTLPKLETLVKKEAKKLGFVVKCFQSNHEGELIDFIQKNAESAKGIIINPGAFTHYSFALHDALLDAQLPAVEVHLSDIKKREAWRKSSVTAPACIAQLCGKKEKGYLDALKILAKQTEVPAKQK
jgi:3-dehydroquinate dehydratase type II